MEYVLSDRTRIDCLTEVYAVEVDFASKWAEAVGQALYYSIMTERRPGVVLIVETPRDLRYLERLHTIADRFNITIWVITPNRLH